MLINTFYKVFGFEQKEHIVFKKNFLRKVIFQFEFNKIELKNFKELVKEVFVEKLPRFTVAEGNGIQISFGNNEPTVQTVKENGNFILKSKSGQVSLEIKDNVVSLSFDSGLEYESFESSKEYLELIISFFEKINVDHFKKFSIRKINIVEFQNDDNPNGIVYFLLNNSLIGNIDCFPNMKLINHNLQAVNFANEDYFLNLKYGMNIPPQTNSKLGQVIVDIDMIKNTKTMLTDMKDIAVEMNGEIFNVFNWIISDNMKRILNE